MTEKNLDAPEDAGKETNSADKANESTMAGGADATDVQPDIPADAAAPQVDGATGADETVVAQSDASAPQVAGAQGGDETVVAQTDSASGGDETDAGAPQVDGASGADGMDGNQAGGATAAGNAPFYARALSAYDPERAAALLESTAARALRDSKTLADNLFHRALGSLSRISTQIYLAFAGAVALTIAAALVGWFSFDSVGEAQRRVNEGSVPEMAAAFGMAQRASTLVDSAPRLTTAADPQAFNVVSGDVGEANVGLVNQLAQLQGEDSGEESYAQMRSYVNSVTDNILAIHTGMVESFPRDTRLQTLDREITRIGREIDKALLDAVDDQFFYIMTGYHSLDEPPHPRSEHFSTNQFFEYQLLSQLQGDASLATLLLQGAFGVSDPALIGPLEQEVSAARDRIRRDLAFLEDAGSDIVEPTTPLMDNLFRLGIGEQGALELLQDKLETQNAQRDLLSENRGIAVQLLDEVDAFVGAVNANVESAALESEQAVFTGKVILATISGISVGGALLIAYLFIGRVLLNRLEHLSVRMRDMADGDLETEVEVKGRDEVTEMAQALEVFRQHALEVQRLNLVEKLALELEGKNSELELVLQELEGKNDVLEVQRQDLASANDNLRLAQDQIVAREKLAALGELTAGVAHEIRNPLNFVKNFSEASDELIEEMNEIIDEGEGSLDEEQISYIKEITQDLIDNLERIRSHGNRADRIVHDMLMMGRGGGEYQLVDLNAIVDEHARLAYHSARAVDPDFNLDMRHEFDPDMGQVRMIPQDLGRVFVNIVSNAGYATDQKRRELTANGGGGDVPFMPTVWITTKRGEESAEVRIKDNGDGIPDEVKEKMFQPFYTTKPTGEGTGLGLAMCNDIIRQHGGAIEVNTEQGQYTEMVITIPLETPAQALEEEAAADDD